MEKKQAEENERIRQRLEYIRTEFQERMSKIAEQKVYLFYFELYCKWSIK